MKWWHNAHTLELMQSDGKGNWYPMKENQHGQGYYSDQKAVEEFLGHPVEFAKQQEPAKKFDAGKAPLSWLPLTALKEIAKVLEFGARKYDRHNWLGGMSWSRLADAALRHIFAWIWGEQNDPESGLNHMAHAGCCILFLLDYIVRGAGTDDRWKDDRVDVF